MRSMPCSGGSSVSQISKLVPSSSSTRASAPECDYDVGGTDHVLGDGLGAVLTGVDSDLSQTTPLRGR